MSGRNSAATDKALRLVAAGASMAEAARKAEIAYTTLYRAMIRAGMKQKRAKTEPPQG